MLFVASNPSREGGDGRRGGGGGREAEAEAEAEGLCENFLLIQLINNHHKTQCANARRLCHSSADLNRCNDFRPCDAFKKCETLFVVSVIYHILQKSKY